MVKQKTKYPMNVYNQSKIHCSAPYSKKQSLDQEIQQQVAAWDNRTHLERRQQS